jgi:hypothetical protein
LDREQPHDNVKLLIKAIVGALDKPPFMRIRNALPDPIHDTPILSQPPTRTAGSDDGAVELLLSMTNQNSPSMPLNIKHAAELESTSGDTESEELDRPNTPEGSEEVEEREESPEIGQEEQDTPIEGSPETGSSQDASPLRSRQSLGASLTSRTAKETAGQPKPTRLAMRSPVSKKATASSAKMVTPKGAAPQVASPPTTGIGNVKRPGAQSLFDERGDPKRRAITYSTKSKPPRPSNVPRLRNVFEVPETPASKQKKTRQRNSRQALESSRKPEALKSGVPVADESDQPVTSFSSEDLKMLQRVRGLDLSDEQLAVVRLVEGAPLNEDQWTKFDGLIDQLASNLKDEGAVKVRPRLQEGYGMFPNPDVKSTDMISRDLAKLASSKSLVKQSGQSTTPVGLINRPESWYHVLTTTPKQVLLGDLVQKQKVSEPTSLDHFENKDLGKKKIVHYARHLPGGPFSREHTSVLRTYDLPGNLLRQSAAHAEGISKPYVYIGEKGSLFSLRTEDEALWSVNYLHRGYKTWIIIPPSQKANLEKFFSWLARHDLKHKPNCDQVSERPCLIDFADFY